MNLENLRDTLNTYGIPSTIITVYKNNVPCKGFRLDIGNPSISPVIYFNDGESEESFIMRAKKIAAENYRFEPKFLSDKDYIRSNVFLSVQKKSCEPLLKKNLLNLEVVVRLMVDFPQMNGSHKGTIKLTPDFLELIQMDPDDIWENAVDNTAERLSIRSMNDVLGLSPSEYSSPLYVVSSDDGLFGASALVFPELFDGFCSDYHCNHIWILPSSTQEVLILPDDSMEFSSEMLSAMVHDVNQSEVEDVLQLDPVVYEYNKGGCGFIRIANEEVCYG